MKDWQKTTVPKTACLRDVINSLEASKSQIVLVLDEAGFLVGVMTDGDVRRAILAGVDLSASVVGIMNTNPTSAPVATPRWRLLSQMREKSLHQLPLLNDEGQVIDLVTLAELAGSVKVSNPVVLMAGGIGKRLRSLTQDCPKPMLKVGKKPILEFILESLIDQGFATFYIAVNYHAEIICDHFGDGAQWGVNIEYLREKEQLGTAGGLSLLPRVPETPVVVVNGDVLTRVDVNEILKFHVQQNALATMGIREYEFQIPYGVVSIQNSNIAQIVEKPVHQYLVSAGIYIVSPPALSHIPHKTYFDMPMLFQKLIEVKAVTRAYPIREYWIDVGGLEELERARREWPNE